MRNKHIYKISFIYLEYKYLGFKNIGFPLQRGSECVSVFVSSQSNSIHKNEILNMHCKKKVNLLE